MNPNVAHSKSLEDWYWQLQECSDDDARGKLISEIRAINAAAAAALEKMLEADQHALSFMNLGDAPAESTSARVAETHDSQPAVQGCSLQVPKQIGPYKLLEPIGEGGMGVVYLAQQSKPVRRKVALKIIKPGMDSRQVIARFEAERQALAMMEHPNIAKVLDAGTTESGLPYFVMELVRGIPMTQYCDQAKMPTRLRLDLFCEACDAIQHAHNKGVIHRDVKPSNVLVTEHDGTPVVKVIDFGVAKALTDNLTEKTLFTGMFQMIGTPLYMSPEQASLSNLDVDVRSDVYSLGVMLYELVCGSLPIDRETAKKLSLEQLRQRICDTEPPRPSKRLSTLKEERVTVAERRGVDLRAIHRLVTNELDWIVMKAIERDRKRRYQSARELREDVRRHLDGDAVLACPPSLGYRTTRYARRHRWLIASVFAVLLTALIGSAVAVRYAIRASESAQDARSAQQSAENLADDYKSLMLTANANADAANRSAEDAIRASELADLHSRKAKRASYVSDIRLAAAKIDQGLQAESLEILTRHAQETDDEDLRGFEWYYLLGEANQSLLGWKASQGTVFGIDWSSDGKFIATVDSHSYCRVWDASTGELRHEWHPSSVLAGCVHWSDDGRFLAWGTAAYEAKVRIWDRRTGSVSEVSEFASSVWSVRWNQDSTQLCVGSITNGAEGLSDQPTVHRFERDSIESTDWTLAASDLFEGNVRLVDWNADETRIWAINEQHGIQLYDPASLERQDHRLPAKVEGSKVCDGAFANLGQKLAMTTRHGHCAIFDGESQTETARFRAHWSEARARWSPDERSLATCGFDGFVKVWDASDWTLRRTFSGHHGKVLRVAWSPDGSKIVSCGADGQVIVWKVADSPDQAVHQARGANGSPRFAWVDHSRIQYIRDNRQLAEIDVHNGTIREGASLADEDGRWELVERDLAICRSPDNQIVGCTDDRLLDAVRRQKAASVHAMISNGKARMAVGGARPLIFDAASNRQPIKIGSKEFETFRQIRFSPNGRYIAIAGSGFTSEDSRVAFGGWLHLIDATSGKHLHRVQVGGMGSPALAVAWSPDEHSLAVGSKDGICAVYDHTRLTQQCSKAIHRADVHSLDFHPDGRRIASAGADQTVFVWDALSGETLLSFSLGASVSQVAWSPDGTKLGALTSAKELYIWDSTPGGEFAQSRAFLPRIEQACISDFDAAVSAEDWIIATEAAERWIDVAQDETYQPFYYGTLLHAFVGDQAAARRHLKTMFERFADESDPATLHFTSWSASLMPGLLDSYTTAIATARRANELAPDSVTVLVGVGATLLRAGKHDEAKQWFERVEAMPKKKVPSLAYLYLLRSINRWNAGDHHAAKAYCVKGEAHSKEELALSPKWNRELTIRLLLSEAKSLIGPSRD